MTSMGNNLLEYSSPVEWYVMRPDWRNREGHARIAMEYQYPVSTDTAADIREASPSSTFSPDRDRLATLKDCLNLQTSDSPTELDPISRLGDVTMYDLDDFSDDDNIKKSDYKEPQEIYKEQKDDMAITIKKIPNTGIRHLMAIRNKDLMAAIVHNKKGTPSTCSSDFTGSITLDIEDAESQMNETQKGRVQRTAALLVQGLRRSVNNFRKRLSLRSCLICRGND